MVGWGAGGGGYAVGVNQSTFVVSTVNVNGLRAAAKKDPGFVSWLSATEADVVCVQETRAEADQLPQGVIAPQGWHVVLAPAAAKGRAGVATLWA